MKRNLRSSGLLPLVCLIVCVAIQLNHFDASAAGLEYNVTRSTQTPFTSLPAGTPPITWRQPTNTDDNLSNTLPIGFNFNYGNINYSNFLVSTNGFITFNTSTIATGAGATPYGYQNSSLASSNTASTLVVAPFYDDLVCQGNSQDATSLQNSIRYSLSGAAGSRVLTVEWKEMETANNAGPNLNFQVKLYEGTNQVEFVYGKMEGFNGTVNSVFSYSCGINNSSISNPSQQGEVLYQEEANSRRFGRSLSSILSSVPECYSTLKLVPQPYSPFVVTSHIPVNDLQVNSLTLPVNPTPCSDYCGTYYSSASATGTGGPAATTGMADDDVWFNFYANNSSSQIRVGGSGNYNAVVEVYNSSLLLVAAANSTLAGLTENLSLTGLITGQQYFVRVFEYSSGWGSTGEFTICVSGVPVPPPNDSCGAAISLLPTGQPAMISGTTLSATPSPNFSGCAVGVVFPDDDVWYSFNAIKATDSVIVQGATGFNGVIQLLSGTCASLTPVACVNNTANGGRENLTATNLTPGAKYYVRVFHQGTGAGTGNFTIGVSAPMIGCTAHLLPTLGQSDIPTAGTFLTWKKINGATSYKILLDSINPPVRVLGITSDTTFATGNLSAATSYYWTILPADVAGVNPSCQVSTFSTIPFSFALRLKIFLEGYYNKSTQKMYPSVNPADTITDTLSVALINSTNHVEYTTTAVLNINGVAEAFFPQPAFQHNYFIRVTHRNSLELWSSVLFGMNDPDTLYDFSLQGNAFGLNTVLIDSGIYAMQTGDVNQDGFINKTDYDMVSGKLQTFSSGYLKEDVNGDRVIESTDYSFIENKYNLGLKRKGPFIQP